MLAISPQHAGDCANSDMITRSTGGVVAGKVETYKDRAGKFRLTLKASNGKVVATGEAYESKAAAKKGCESVHRAATGTPIEEVDS